PRRTIARISFVPTFRTEQLSTLRSVGDAYIPLSVIATGLPICSAIFIFGGTGSSFCWADSAAVNTKSTTIIGKANLILPVNDLISVFIYPLFPPISTITTKRITVSFNTQQRFVNSVSSIIFLAFYATWMIDSVMTGVFASIGTAFDLMISRQDVTLIPDEQENVNL